MEFVLHPAGPTFGPLMYTQQTVVPSMPQPMLVMVTAPVVMLCAPTGGTATHARAAAAQKAILLFAMLMASTALFLKGNIGLAPSGSNPILHVRSDPKLGIDVDVDRIGGTL